MSIRLCYASQYNENSDNLLQDLRDILTIARDFNVRHQICGVLYYADNTFFQCLEGEQVVVEALFTRIQRDPRHHQIIHFGTHPIERTEFKQWSMKYVQRNSNIEHFFKGLDQEAFNISMLNENNLMQFLNELLIAEQTVIQTRKKVGYTNRGVNPF